LDQSQKPGRASGKARGGRGLGTLTLCAGGKNRWAVALEGEPFDLEDANELFADTPAICIRKINVPVDRNPTVLMADVFEQLDDAANVLEASNPLVDLINGILFVRACAQATEIGRCPRATKRWHLECWNNPCPR
jgi:hypothetical protein